MKNMAFSLTTRQMRDKTKDVTRRVGWAFLKPGDRVCAIVKGQGLKKGEKIERLGIIEIVSNTPEDAGALIAPRIKGYKNYTEHGARREVDREGFPGHSVVWFVQMLIKHNNLDAGDTVNRIEFIHID
jgi:hypothetical protein